MNPTDTTSARLPDDSAFKTQFIGTFRGVASLRAGAVLVLL